MSITRTKQQYDDIVRINLTVKINKALWYSKEILSELMFTSKL